MQFLNKEHAVNFNELIQKDNTHPRDTERYSLFYIIAGNEDLFRKRKFLYDFESNGIKANCLDDGNADLSSSAKALVRLAFNLFNSYEDKYTTPIDIFYSLDDKNYSLAMNSIDIRFGRGIESEKICYMEQENDEELEI
ncbi:hypothetical protein A500_10460 [Clostridium sartagoforme AAU1]|uniref:Uncharacterized protein n=1 Tax=Clostridium sartagoforme AAU1 TaxID=1202534 RepID=R9C7K4_9CLOT|nr:DUF6075 family protein [Clostridium sartagoforme]EOR25292.1 hypothetical protein A500_10460 [Clostridium sartagoforme AAU1]